MKLHIIPKKGLSFSLNPIFLEIVNPDRRAKMPRFNAFLMPFDAFLKGFGHISSTPDQLIFPFTTKICITENQRNEFAKNRKSWFQSGSQGNLCDSWAEGELPSNSSSQTKSGKTKYNSCFNHALHKCMVLFIFIYWLYHENGTRLLEDMVLFVFLTFSSCVVTYFLFSLILLYFLQPFISYQHSVSVLLYFFFSPFLILYALSLSPFVHFPFIHPLFIKPSIYSIFRGCEGSEYISGISLHSFPLLPQPEY